LIPLFFCTYLALALSPPKVPVFRLGDIVLHASAFIYLTFALVTLKGWASHASTGSTDVAVYRHSAAWMLAYGVLIELVQSLEPERTAELKDLMVDIAGIGVGLLVAKLLAPVARNWADRVSRLLSKGA